MRKARCFYYALKEVINGVITVQRKKGQITVSGHAGYAEKGHDIVCAAVLILIYNLQNSIERLTDDTVGFSFWPGCNNNRIRHIKRQRAFACQFIVFLSFT